MILPPSHTMNSSTLSFSHNDRLNSHIPSPTRCHQPKVLDLGVVGIWAAKHAAIHRALRKAIE